MLQENQFSNFQLILLRCISSGYKNIEQIDRTLNTDEKIIKRSIEGLVKRDFVKKRGFISKKLKLTDMGINLMTYYGYEPSIQSTKSQLDVKKQEIRHTTTFGTGFKLTFSGIMGILTAWLIVGVIASIIYWSGYYFILRRYIPQSILTYLPLDNPLVFILLGLNTSVAIFLPIKRHAPLIDTNERIQSNM